MLTRLPAIGLIFVLTTAGAAETTSADELQRATLVQLSVESPGVDPVEIRRVVAAEAKRITSCADGFKLAGWLRARGLAGSMQITVTPNVLLSRIPLPLRTELLDRPIGRATSVYGGQNAVRVMIRCDPAFIAPRQDSPSAVQRQEI